jgi:hypothetical protein
MVTAKTPKQKTTENRGTATIVKLVEIAANQRTTNKTKPLK